MKKTWTPLPYDLEELQNLQSALKIHPIFCQILLQRGIKTYDAAKQFFRPSLKDLHDPFLMKNMVLAVHRLIHALKNKQKIMLYGDYDVDGTTAVALLYTFLKPYAKYNNLSFYIPDRYKEGYGVSMESVEFAKTEEVDLVIALDCGIKANEAVNRARLHGIDYIICDHHLPSEKLPDAIAILNPKQADCNYPYKELSGCGIAFKLAQAITEKYKLPTENLYSLLDLVVISIACDIVPMVGENRILAKFGIQKLNKTKRQGLQALLQISKRETPLTISDIVFGFGPLINAAGRLADAARAVQLLIAETFDEATKQAVVLAERNKLRKEFDTRIVEEAKELVMAMPDWEERKSIVLYQPHWHKGIVGIAAARMVDHFHKPTIILTQSNGHAVGSARTIRGFNIHDAIQSCENLLVNFGGHAHAAGLTLNPENISHFQDRFEGYVSTFLEIEQEQPEIQINAQMNLKDITLSFWNILEQFAPFGPNNRNPIFVSRAVKDVGYSRILTGNHLRLMIKQEESKPMGGIAFGRGDDFLNVTAKKHFDVCYTLQMNKWRGESRLQLMVKDMAF